MLKALRISFFFFFVVTVAQNVLIRQSEKSTFAIFDLLRSQEKRKYSYSFHRFYFFLLESSIIFFSDPE